jgi:hypothetical protein
MMMLAVIILLVVVVLVVGLFAWGVPWQTRHGTGGEGGSGGGGGDGGGGSGSGGGGSSYRWEGVMPSSVAEVVPGYVLVTPAL